MLRNTLLGILVVGVLVLTPAAHTHAATEAEIRTQLRVAIIVLIERLEELIIERQVALAAEAEVFATSEVNDEDEVVSDEASNEEDGSVDVEDEAVAIAFNETDNFSSEFSLRDNVGNDSTDDQGQFEFTFSFGAFDSDFFVNDAVALGNNLAAAQAAGAGILISVLDDAGVELTAGEVDSIAVTIADTNTDQESSGRYLLEEGELSTFTVRVLLDPAAAGFYSIRFNGVAYNEVDADPIVYQQARPVVDYETAAEFINH